jgi:hypothetical protein
MSGDLTSLDYAINGILELPESPIPLTRSLFSEIAKSHMTRLTFHFCTADKPTNKLDKPEWMFSYVSFLLLIILDREINRRE